MVSLLFLMLGASNAQAQDLATVLKQIEQNPRQYMDALPAKTGKSSVSFFSSQDIQNGTFIDAKNRLRPYLGRAKIKKNDRAEDLVDAGENLIRNIKELQKRRLSEGEVAIQPWSDYYWPLYNGQIAFRYADKNFPKGEKNWAEKFSYIGAKVKNYSNTSLLSPAEKYDLLVGDSSRTLTHKALADGDDYFRNDGKIERWMGICHGWAPASYMLDRPENAVTVLAADGATEITFFPSDIKALASLLWAVYPGETNFVGGRCDTKKPKTDKNGRVIDQDCFDTNPGTWHIAVLNQVGIAKKSLVMDATFDYQVWNQPLVRYSFELFNPQSMMPVGTLREATVKLPNFIGDRFSEYRTKKTTKVVGVRMKVDYGMENAPTTNLADSKELDSTESVNYIYDLELDDNDDIVGGEWYFNAHPDFLWTPTKNSRALTPGDEYLITGASDWRPRRAFPKDWAEVAARVSENGSPLALVVEKLIQLSKGR
jgi:hypothetical protein